LHAKVIAAGASPGTRIDNNRARAEAQRARRLTALICVLVFISNPLRTQARPARLAATPVRLLVLASSVAPDGIDDRQAVDECAYVVGPYVVHTL
jgi:hypothetical protein